MWLDAHGDFNTPELGQSGFLDGQGLAMVVGRCWQAVTSAVPGFCPLPEQRALLIGARSLDEAEEAALRRSGVTGWRQQARNPGAAAAALTALAREADVVHFHVDLDVYDPSIAPANSNAAPDGLLADDVRRIVGQTADRLPIVSAALASYDPTLDPAARLRRTAVDLACQLATSRTAIPRWAAVAAEQAVTAVRAALILPTAAVSRTGIEQLLTRQDIALRERTLWRMLYRTAARSAEMLALDAGDLDLPNRRARVRCKGWRDRRHRDHRCPVSRLESALACAAPSASEDLRPFSAWAASFLRIQWAIAWLSADVQNRLSDCIPRERAGSEPI